MHAEEQLDENQLRPELIDEVRVYGERLQVSEQGPAQELLGSWLCREVHLTIRRAHEMIVDGVPPDTAFFLAMDDSGFQLACAYVRACTG